MSRRRDALRIWLYAWIWTALGWLCACLPDRLQRGFGRWLGALLWRLMPDWRWVAIRNLSLCFPHWQTHQHRSLARDSFSHLGYALFALALALWGSDRRIDKLIQVQGDEQLRHWQRLGMPVLLIGFHFFPNSLAIRALAQRMPIHVVARMFVLPAVARVLRRLARRTGGGYSTGANPRIILTELRRGHTVLMLPDQDIGVRGSCFTPFFGIPAATMTSVARYARLTRAQVMVFRLSPRGRGYVLNLEPLSQWPDADDVAAMQRLNELLEHSVCSQPSWYFWQHRRFDTRPLGVPDRYAPAPTEPQRRSA
jgi:KDO2-lipid IV(A) lauroyltransferase